MSLIKSSELLNHWRLPMEPLATGFDGLGCLLIARVTWLVDRQAVSIAMALFLIDF